MKIRRAALDDAPALAELTTELGYPADTAAVRERIVQLSDRSDDVVLVADDGRVVAGSVQARTSVVLESGRTMEIVGLIVSKRFRRRGVGTLLVAAAESWGRERGADVFCVRTNVRRVESHAFYSARGYIETKVQTVYRKWSDTAIGAPRATTVTRLPAAGGACGEVTGG